MADGITIEAIHGRVTKVEKRFEGTNAKGAWSIQKIQVQDATGAIKVMFSGLADIPQSWVGQDIYIQAGQSNGKTGGLCGLTSATDAKANPPEKIVKASEKAVVQFGQAPQIPVAPPAQTFAPPPQPAFQPSAPAPVQQTFTPPPAPMAPPGESVTPYSDIPAVRHHLSKAANLYLYAIEAGYYVRKTHDALHTDHPMTDDQFQACVSSLFIQSDRALMVNKCNVGTFKG